MDRHCLFTTRSLLHPFRRQHACLAGCFMCENSICVHVNFFPCSIRIRVFVLSLLLLLLMIFFLCVFRCCGCVSEWHTQTKWANEWAVFRPQTPTNYFVCEKSVNCKRRKHANDNFLFLASLRLFKSRAINTHSRSHSTHSTNRKWEWERKWEKKRHIMKIPSVFPCECACARYRKSAKDRY